MNNLSDTTSAYQQKIEAKLEQYQANINKFRAKAKEVAADSKLEYNQQLETMEKAMDKAKGILNEVKEKGEEATEDLKQRMMQAMDELQSSVQREE